MKAKVFIRSASQSLDIANAIRENLKCDAELIIWNQGITKLSETSLSGLALALSPRDFAIFVFNPGDIGIVQGREHSAVRDNIIFELGLFIGKLGQSNVFYVVPENDAIRLPTDLLGIPPGKYDANISGEDSLEALKPFCDRVRLQLRHFDDGSVNELDGESETAKKIVLEKPFGFEHLLLAELIETRLNKTKALYESLRNGSYFIRAIGVTDQEYHTFFRETLEDFKGFVDVFTQLINVEIQKALGAPGVSSKVSDLKDFSDKLLNLSTRLFNWEVRNEQLLPPQELSRVKTLLRGSSTVILSQLNCFPDEIRRVIRANQKPDKTESECTIALILEMPTQVEEALDIFQGYIQSRGGLQ